MNDRDIDILFVHRVNTGEQTISETFAAPTGAGILLSGCKHMSELLHTLAVRNAPEARDTTDIARGNGPDKLLLCNNKVVNLGMRVGGTSG